MTSLLAIAAVAAADRDESRSPSHGLAQIAEVEQRAADALPILAKSRGAADTMPPDISRRLAAKAPFGMNPDLSRVAIGNATNSVFVVPARDRVCVVLTDGDAADISCPGTADVEAGKAGASTVTIKAGGIAIYGLVPDGVDSVAVDTGRSDAVKAETSNNAYYTVVPAGTSLRSVRYVGPSGAVEFPIYDPAAVADR